jgi:hypothetical protein
LVSESSGNTLGLMERLVMTILSTAAGIALIAVVLRDIFDTLFAPRSRGGISSRLAHTLWRMIRRVARSRPGILPVAGPSILLAVIGFWTAGLALGWALVYWPHLPGAFLIAPGSIPTRTPDFSTRSTSHS